MYNYALRIEVQEGEVKKILDELTEAQETIYKCYNKLQSLGVVHITPEPPATTDDSVITINPGSQFPQ